MRNIILGFRLDRDPDIRIHDFVTPTMTELVTLISPFCLFPLFRDKPYVKGSTDEIAIREESIRDRIYYMNSKVDSDSWSDLLHATHRAKSGWIWEGIASKLQKVDIHLRDKDSEFSTELLGDFFDMYTMAIQIYGANVFQEVLDDRVGAERDPNLTFFDRFSEGRLRKTYEKEIVLASRYVDIPSNEKTFLC
jgi:hypothetical protein